MRSQGIKGSLLLLAQFAAKADINGFPGTTLIFPCQNHVAFGCQCINLIAASTWQMQP